MANERNFGAEMKAYFDAELRKLAVLPPSTLEVALRPYLEPFVQMTQVLQSVQRTWLEWVKQNHETLLRVGQAVREVTTKVESVLTEWDDASQRFAEILQEGGTTGNLGRTLQTNCLFRNSLSFGHPPVRWPSRRPHFLKAGTR